MEDDRRLILETLRAQTPQPASPTLHRMTEPTDVSLISPVRPPASEYCEQFIAAAKRNHAAVISLATLHDLPAAVAVYLQDNGLPAAVVCQDSLTALPWQEAGVQAESRAAREDDCCGITLVPAAAADSGAMLQTDAVAYTLSIGLLPPYHIAVVYADDIVADMPAVWQRLPMPLPRGVVLFCGPSRTADIEQTLTLGAHGPIAVLVAVVRHSE